MNPRCDPWPQLQVWAVGPALARREDIEMRATSWRYVTVYEGRSKKSHLEAQLVDVHGGTRVTYWVPV